MKAAIVIPCYEPDRAYLPDAIASTRRIDADVHVLISMLPLSVALNRLIVGAKDADYIVRLDADDVLCEPAALGLALHYLDMFTDVYMVYGSMSNFNFHNPPGANCIFRRSVWEQLGGYDESLRHQEATDFDLRVRRLYPDGIRLLGVSWYEYRRRSNSMSSNREGINEARAYISRKLNVVLEPL